MIDTCYIEDVGDELILMRRKLPNGRIISIDTCDRAMLGGGHGIAHLNMNNADNRADNLRYVSEQEARYRLSTFQEEENDYSNLMLDSDLMHVEYLKMGGESDLDEYRIRLKTFYLHTLLSHFFDLCGLQATPDRDENGFYVHADGVEAELAAMEELGIDRAEFHRILESCDAVHAYT